MICAPQLSRTSTTASWTPAAAAAPLDRRSASTAMPLRYCHARSGTCGHRAERQRDDPGHDGAAQLTGSAMRRAPQLPGRRAVHSASHGASGSMKRGPR